MKLVRVKDCPYPSRIRNAQVKGRLKRFVDNEGYLCYDVDEYNDYKANPRKTGRPLKESKNV